MARGGMPLPGPAAPAPAPASLADRAERAAALAAVEKQSRGESLTRAEISLLRRREQSREREHRAAAYGRCSGEDLCRLLASSRKQLTRYQGYGAPRNDDGSYNLGQFLPWLLEHERARLAAERARGESALDQLRQLDFERRKRQDAADRGEIAPVDHFEAEFARLGGQLREQLMAWANRLAPKVAGLDAIGARAALAGEARELLGRLARAPKEA